MRKVLITIGWVVAGCLVPLMVTSPALAQADIYGGDACINNSNSIVCRDSGDDGTGVEAVVKGIVDILLFIVGIVSVIVIIVSGIKFATSIGDASKISAARHTMIYAVVGLVVAIFAYAIVQLVYKQMI